MRVPKPYGVASAWWFVGACTCQDPALEAEPVAPVGAPTIRKLGAPRPDPALRGSPAFVEGSTWDADGRRFEFGARLRIDGELAGRDVLPEGGPFRGGHLVGLGPCWGMVWLEPQEAWVPMTRTTPACTPEEARWAGEAFATWELPGGDRYLDLADGRVWRSGPDRTFQRPIGEREATGALTFGPSRFRVVALDGCHRVFALAEPPKVSRAHRHFPPCEPGEGTWEGPSWTSWRTDIGVILHVDGEDGASSAGPWSIDRPDRPAPDQGRWQADAGGVSLGDAGSLKIEGCRGSWTWAGQTYPVERAYPACAQATK